MQCYIMQYYIAHASSFNTVRSTDTINTLIVDNVLKHTLLVCIEYDYCPMQPRIITLCYITIMMRRAAYLFPLGLLHTHTRIHTDAGSLLEHLVLYNTPLWCQNPFFSVLKVITRVVRSVGTAAFRYQPAFSSCYHSQDAKLTTQGKLTRQRRDANDLIYRRYLAPKMLCNTYTQIKITKHKIANQLL